jgi:hypothetical protein
MYLLHIPLLLVISNNHIVQHDLEYTETKTQERRQTYYQQAHIPQILSEKKKAELN